jgi:hypothetical protein
MLLDKTKKGFDRRSREVFGEQPKLGNDPFIGVIFNFLFELIWKRLESLVFMLMDKLLSYPFLF